MKRIKLFSYFCAYFFVALDTTVLLAQDNPVPQPLPYIQTFEGLLHNSTAYPPGWHGWNLGTNPAGTTSFRLTPPVDSRLLNGGATASTSTGNIHNYDGKIGFLNTGSLDLAIVLAVNTSNLHNIQVNFEIMTIRNPHDGNSNTRVSEVALQYRIGNTGNFIAVEGVAYQNPTTLQTSGVLPQNPRYFSIVLPREANNQPEVQLRWLSRQVSGGGGRPGFAVDNISVTGSMPAVVAPFIIAVGGNDSTINTPGGWLQLLAIESLANPVNHDVYWSVNDPGVATISSSGVLTALTNGKVTAIATARDGSGSSATRDILITGQLPSNIFAPGTTSAFVFPNPVSDMLRVTSGEVISRVTLINLTGSVVMVVDGKDNNAALNVSTLPGGTYFVVVELLSGKVGKSVVLKQ